MKKNLDVMPVGAPWGGPESVRFVSCFASMVMAMEGGDGGDSFFCNQGSGLNPGEPCTGCGRCGEFDPKNRRHEEIYHFFLTASGLSMLTAWPPGMDCMLMEELSEAMIGDGWIGRMMDFAGYEYELMDDPSREACLHAVRDSIAGGAPLLARDLAGSGWCLVTGWGEDGDTLYGRYTPKPYLGPGSPANAADEEGRFARKDWHHPGLRLIRVTGRRPPSLEYGPLLTALADLLDADDASGCLSGPAAWDACLAALNDDAFASGADAETMKAFYCKIHHFIGMLAESRCFAAFAFIAGFYGRIHKPLNFMRVVGSYFMDTHNVCWKAWAAMGRNHICQPELYAEGFRSPEVRREVAGLIDSLRRNDEMAMELLRDSARVGWFRPVPSADQ